MGGNDGDLGPLVGELPEQGVGGQLGHAVLGDERVGGGAGPLQGGAGPHRVGRQQPGPSSGARDERPELPRCVALQPQQQDLDRGGADVDADDSHLLIADTAQAVKELDQDGIYTYCINLDPDADDYVQEIFGNQYTVIDHVERLPEKLPQLFMALTK